MAADTLSDLGMLSEDTLWAVAKKKNENEKPEEKKRGQSWLEGIPLSIKQ